MLGAYALGSVFATLTILAKLESMAIPVTMRDRLQAIVHDLIGLATSYLPLLLIAFAVAMPVAVYLGNRLARVRVLIYGLAGASAVLVLHLTMKAVLGVNGIAAVRELPGLALQALAGWFGAYLFFVFTGQAHR